MKQDDSNKEEKLEGIIRDLLQELGEDPGREGLLRTPHRVATAMRMLTGGHEEKIDEVLNGAVFGETCDEMVLVKDIEVYSLCEHHMLPFFGRAHVAYLPAGKIIGLSKLARIVDVFARRLQVQERLTQQIAHCLDEALKPHGVAVAIQAQHLCMMMRGVEKQNSKAVTSCMLGVFKESQRTREEFLHLSRSDF
ncbi:MAG: GTP cyclohydrolase I FolE [Candidatus Wallbacteria bacterium]|nr:GTP cyclohydrolase I FolE [Candidatus Wallbacteria bacterium]